MAGSYKSEKSTNITAIDIINFKCFCINGSIFIGTREPIFISFAFDKALGHKINKKPGIKFFKETNKSVLFLITVYLEDDDHKSVDFNGDTVSSACNYSKYKFLQEPRHN